MLGIFLLGFASSTVYEYTGFKKQQTPDFRKNSDSESDSSRPSLEAERAFLSWMRQYQFTYSGIEYHYRFNLWQSKRNTVNQFNALGESYRLGLNKFSAMTDSEVGQLCTYTTTEITPKPDPRNGVPKSSVPNSQAFDWRAHGAVLAVRDQGSGGSCWCFGSLAAVETKTYLARGRLDYLSTSNLWDCANPGGGNDAALNWICNNEGGYHMKESDYPYSETIRYPTCYYDRSKAIETVHNWYRPTTSGDEDAIASALEKDGVVAIGYECARNFGAYSSGIYYDGDCNHQRNHSMAVVGFGEGDDRGTWTKYWIVRNSWGGGWGEAGYIRTKRGVGDKCGLADDVIIPIA
ncbi:Pro-cathepsin H [Tritrichomonas foetus]|uniref:Pro-cathepsin H n=1 Tax=Tritrichomonas foetus TaxID=1144522 RepID=A0A1J4J3E5_9EUKA|nr:Pro-cathepsin H [Tritrichomonas foetus]|eukprot:OHS93976.1 Pro-cathepsin H [Tritrichomonas foetus]